MRLWTAFLSVILVIGIACTSANAPSDEQWRTHTDATYGVQIDYPASWTAVEDPSLIFNFLAPDSEAGVSLVMTDVSGQGYTLESYTEAALNQMAETFPEAEIVESGAVRMSGEPAGRIVVSVPGQNGQMRLMQTWTIKDDILYSLTYAAQESLYAKHATTAQTMLESFKIGALSAEARSGEPQAEAPAAEPVAAESTAEDNLVGKWRVYSEAIYYDAGGNNWLDSPTSRTITLTQDGKWVFGDSRGTWKIEPITAEDWLEWGIESYGPTRKMVLNNWNKGTSEGPIEETAARVDFFWAIYHVEPPLVQDPGTIWMKFGHTN